MPILTPDQLHDVCAQSLRGLGCPPEEAEVVAESMVRANLAGHDSHGVIRLEQYVRMVRGGECVPGAPTVTLREAPCTALLDGGWNFGQVIAHRAVDQALEKARQYGTGTISVRNSQHVGRLGEYTLRIAEAGLIGLATVNNHGRGNLVAPFGGSDGRLSTNPVSFACPGPNAPLLVDITTSVVAEGKVRLKRNAGQPVPEGWLIDSEGRPTTEARVLYEEPRGALLPVGGTTAGHKGFALSLMVDVLSGALSGGGCSQSLTARNGNTLFVQAIDPTKFLPMEEFLEQVRALEAHVRASPPAPGFSAVILPGEPEAREEQRRRREGIAIDAETWRQICECARSLGAEIPAV